MIQECGWTQINILNQDQRKGLDHVRVQDQDPGHACEQEEAPAPVGVHQKELLQGDLVHEALTKEINMNTLQNQSMAGITLEDPDFKIICLIKIFHWKCKSFIYLILKCYYAFVKRTRFFPRFKCVYVNVHVCKSFNPWVNPFETSHPSSRHFLLFYCLLVTWIDLYKSWHYLKFVSLCEGLVRSNKVTKLWPLHKGHSIEAQS